MPPKAKFTREELIDAALGIVKRNGFDALTARSLGAELNCSPRPIFTVFDSMDELQTEVTSAARRLYEQYEDEGMGMTPSFKGSGVGYIRFAAEQPKLFQLLFMRERESIPDSTEVLKTIDNYYERIVQSVIDEYGFSREISERLYLHMWLYSHGIATTIATGVCAFTGEQISGMLTEVCATLIRKIRKDGTL